MFSYVAAGIVELDALNNIYLKINTDSYYTAKAFAKLSSSKLLERTIIGL